jgi:hypothetical protein
MDPPTRLESRVFVFSRRAASAHWPPPRWPASPQKLPRASQRPLELQEPGWSRAPQPAPPRSMPRRRANSRSPAAAYSRLETHPLLERSQQTAPLQEKVRQRRKARLLAMVRQQTKGQPQQMVQQRKTVRIPRSARSQPRAPLQEKVLRQPTAPLPQQVRSQPTVRPPEKVRLPLTAQLPQ